MAERARRDVAEKLKRQLSDYSGILEEPLPGASQWDKLVYRTWWAEQVRMEKVAGLSKEDRRKIEDLQERISRERKRLSWEKQKWELDMVLTQITHSIRVKNIERMVSRQFDFQLKSDYLQELTKQEDVLRRKTGLTRQEWKRLDASSFTTRTDHQTSQEIAMAYRRLLRRYPGLTRRQWNCARTRFTRQEVHNKTYSNYTVRTSFSDGIVEEGPMVARYDDQGHHTGYTRQGRIPTEKLPEIWKNSIEYRPRVSGVVSGREYWDERWDQIYLEPREFEIGDRVIGTDRVYTGWWHGAKIASYSGTGGGTKFYLNWDDGTSMWVTKSGLIFASHGQLLATK